MPLVITINPNSGELQSNISLLSLCNTWCPRHFPSCCRSPFEVVFFFYSHVAHVGVWVKTIRTLYHMCINIDVPMCTHICFIMCQCLHIACVTCVQSDISTPHTHTDTHKGTRMTWTLLRDSTHVKFVVQSTVNSPDQVIQGYFLKSCVQQFDDALASATAPVWVAHWQGC